MSIINVKVSSIRPKYQNLQEWINDENNVYIGRSGIVFINGERIPKEQSKFANLYKITKECSRDEATAKYKKYIEYKIWMNSEFREELLSLKGKTLGCWCHPEPWTKN